MLSSGDSMAQQATLADDSTYPQSVGSSQDLVVQGPNAVRNQPSASAYIKFKLTGSSSTQMGDLPSGTPGKDVKKAALRLFVTSVTTPATFDVFPVTGSWAEGGTTAPTYDTTKPVITGVQVTGQNTFVAFDITPLVKQWLDYDPANPSAGGMVNNGIAIVPAKDVSGAVVSPNMIINFDSKEAKSTSHLAQLSVVLDHVAEADHAIDADHATMADSATSVIGTVNAGQVSGALTNATIDGSKVIGSINANQINGKVASAANADSAINANSVTNGVYTTGSYSNPSWLASLDGAKLTGNINASTQYSIGGVRVLSSAGVANFFAGGGAGINNTTGHKNSLFGVDAGRNNTTGEGNSFFGNGAGAANTMGHYNSFFGAGAGPSNTTGRDNSFFGVNAGNSSTTGNDNSFFGVWAGKGNTTGSGNSFLGRNTGISNTTGAYNTIVGSGAGQSNTTEARNTFIGANWNGAAGITNATALGSDAVVTQSNSVVLGNNASVGIGTSAPQAKLHVEGGTSLAGKFTGNVEVNGNLTVSGTTNIPANVYHDATLSGNGTSSSPLGVATIDGSKVIGTVANATTAERVTGTVGGSQISGALTNATMDSSKLTGSIQVNAASGNVGIGVAPADHKLFIDGGFGRSIHAKTRNQTAIWAVAVDGLAVDAWGQSNGVGVKGSSTTSTGVFGTSESGYGIHGRSVSGVGVYGEVAGNGLAGKFSGAVEVNGNFKVTGSATIGASAVIVARGDDTVSVSQGVGISSTSVSVGTVNGQANGGLLCFNLPFTPSNVAVTLMKQFGAPANEAQTATAGAQAVAPLTFGNACPSGTTAWVMLWSPESAPSNLGAFYASFR